MSLHKKGVPCIHMHPDYVKDFIMQQHLPDVTKYKANIYTHLVKKITNCGYHKITMPPLTNHQQLPEISL